MLTADSDGITIPGYYGTYYVADCAVHNGEHVYLLRSEQSSGIEALIVSGDGSVLRFTVYDMFDILASRTGDRQKAA
jgi:hypothetical protein